MEFEQLFDIEENVILVTKKIALELRHCSYFINSCNYNTGSVAAKTFGFKGRRRKISLNVPLLPNEIGRIYGKTIVVEL